ncbi:D-aminoacyl-tRNA deacylase [Zoogloea sp.]|uniref:D-aminoacyl-tRNA deacylase n=1 Tax=Zoogloea sp. TaxID=49181 RepID=UPI002B9BAD17|nr:D-aminoacyl-tRNA deacylase [Zoogloea sp.]HNH15953.1 D-aminoacyl-tRNA deacylase [Zoogloea sp.]
MIAVIQRVLEARVTVDGRIVGAIGPGLLALVAVEKGDDSPRTARMAERLMSYRVFADEAGRMNRSLAETGGGLLLVSQFTLAADTARGTRPSFTPAAAPEDARRLFDELVRHARVRHPDVATGEFAADMKVALINDGPVTFRLTT